MSNIVTEEEKAQAIADNPGELPYQVVSVLGQTPSAPAGGIVSAGPTIGKELRALLSVSPTDDPEAIQRALLYNFKKVVDEDGFERVVYSPGGVPTVVDAGEVTGVQGSLHAFTEPTITQALDALEKLEPLVEATADDEAMRASVAVVGSLLRQIRDEIPAPGGPNVALVTRLFEQLFGANPTGDATAVEGALGELRERFYLDRDYIANLRDEANYTRFLTLVGAVYSVELRWEDYLASLISDPYFGPQVVPLKRVLQSIVEDVDEALDALDAVNIDLSERQLISVPLDDTQPDTSPRIFLQATLDWVKRFAGEEAAYLLEEAGKDGAAALQPTLAAMVDACKAFYPPVENAPDYYESPPVKAALGSLVKALIAATEIVDRISPPEVQTVTSRQPTRPGEDYPPEPLPPPSSPTPPIILVGTFPARSERVRLDLGGVGDDDKVFLVDSTTNTWFEGERKGERGDVKFFVWEIDDTWGIPDAGKGFELVIIHDGQEFHTGETITLIG